MMEYKDGIRKIKFTIDSSLENVALVGTAVRKLCSMVSFSETEACDIEVSVVEAVNNAVKHAYMNEKGHEVNIIFTIHTDRLTIDICDTGKTMDKINFPVLKFDPKLLNSIPEKGMGFHIISSIMDQVEYRTIQNKNILSITRFFNTSDQKK